MNVFRPQESIAKQPSSPPVNRSGEELAMRALIVPELRKRYPGARIIHELPLRYSTNRIDLAAVTETEIVAVEIKSSKDVCDRLAAQLRAFVPISSHIIVALAPKWNEKLPMKKQPPRKIGVTSWSNQYTPAQQIIEDVGGSIETWTVDVALGSIQVTDGAYLKNAHPWLARMLDILHVAELVSIASRHRCWQGRRPVHDVLVAACAELMTGREIVAAVCAALRARDAFASGTDAPIEARTQ